MFIEERLQEIVNLLKQEGKVLVKDLSLRFNVSEGMIRKDLQRLEGEGKLKRTYGGAIVKRSLVHESSISTRKIENIDAKKKIAQKAFDLINMGDIIFLDISSINYILAEMIAKSNLKITVVTNMVDVSIFFSENTETKLICIGGIYDKKLGGIVGSAAIENILKYRVDKAFIGSCGVDISDHSVSNFDIEEGNTKKSIMTCGKTVYLIMENEKFNYDGAYKFANLSDLDGIITEGNPESNITKSLKENNIIVI